MGKHNLIYNRRAKKMPENFPGPEGLENSGRFFFVQLVKIRVKKLHGQSLMLLTP